MHIQSSTFEYTKIYHSKFTMMHELNELEEMATPEMIRNDCA